MKKITVLARRIIKAPVMLFIRVVSDAQHFKMYEKWHVPLRLEHLFGFYEKEATRFFKKNIQKGMTIVDVGANVGYYTKLFSKLVGPGGSCMRLNRMRKHFHI